MRAFHFTTEAGNGKVNVAVDVERDSGKLYRPGVLALELEHWKLLKMVLFRWQRLKIGPLIKIKD